MATNGLKGFIASFAKSFAVGYAIGYLGEAAKSEVEKKREIRRADGPKTDEDLLKEQLYALGRNQK